MLSLDADLMKAVGLDRFAVISAGMPKSLALDGKLRFPQNLE
jgi:hypothetical protein